jgi:LacI family transcriptional regulator
MTSYAGHVVSVGTSADHAGEQAGYAVTKNLIAGKVRPDGIFCFNDPIAIGSMRAILDSGLRVPEDIAVVGCGNLSYSDFLRVSLTSVDQNSAMIGKIAASLALKIAHSKTPMRAKNTMVPPQLVVRSSSLRKPGSSTS